MLIDSNFFKFRTKKYIHFDSQLHPEKVFQYVTCSKKVERHSFYPFIQFQVKSKKIGIKLDSNNKKNLEIKIKTRPIKYASHIDSHIYAYYSHLLNNYYENTLSKESLSTNILAFRKISNSPSNIHFAKDVFDEIKIRQNCSVLCLDIKSFFDELDHQILKNSWIEVLGTTSLPNDHFQVFKSITRYSYVNQNEIYEKLSINKKIKAHRLCSALDFRNKIRKNKLIYRNTEIRGIPQGSSISATLSNIYMLNFDRDLTEYLKKQNGRYFRYCDDILVICDTEKFPETLLRIQSLIKKTKLTIQDSKTRIVTFKNGVKTSKDELQYLGFTYDGNKILLRHGGIAKYSHKSAKAIRMSHRKLLKINRSRSKRNETLLELRKKHIYKKFTYIGQRNYISYAIRASKIMNEPAIKSQIKPHWKRIKSLLNYYENLNQTLS